jgi:hypothetical protein
MVTLYAIESNFDKSPLHSHDSTILYCASLSLTTSKKLIYLESCNSLISKAYVDQSVDLLYLTLLLAFRNLYYNSHNLARKGLWKKCSWSMSLTNTEAEFLNRTLAKWNQQYVKWIILRLEYMNSGTLATRTVHSKIIFTKSCL